MQETTFDATYATFGLNRSVQQIRHAWKSRQYASDNMIGLLDGVVESEQRITEVLGRPMEDLRILEIGPGQGKERARYFSLKNEVLGLDLDVIPSGVDPVGYYQMLRKNGVGRVAKTMGRQLIVGNANAAAWDQAVGSSEMRDPVILHGDICQEVPERNAFDLVMTWSVFEHLPDPRQALQNVIDALSPGGAFYISLHLYTSNNGHHDIRAFTGQEDTLPLWAHLRPSRRDEIDPSSYLNEWRLHEWRELLDELAPGHTEILEKFEHPERYGPYITPELKADMDADYSDEELLTVNIVYAWRKPE